MAGTVSFLKAGADALVVDQPENSNLSTGTGVYALALDGLVVDYPYGDTTPQGTVSVSAVAQVNALGNKVNSTDLALTALPQLARSGFKVAIGDANVSATSQFTLTADRLLGGVIVVDGTLGANQTGYGIRIGTASLTAQPRVFADAERVFLGDPITIFGGGNVYQSGFKIGVSGDENITATFQYTIEENTPTFYGGVASVTAKDNIIAIGEKTIATSLPWYTGFAHVYLMCDVYVRVAEFCSAVHGSELDPEFEVEPPPPPPSEELVLGPLVEYGDNYLWHDHYDIFGDVHDLNQDGSIFATVDSSLAPDADGNTGQVIIYRHQSSVLTGIDTLQPLIGNSDGYGITSIAISGDGNTLLVGRQFTYLDSDGLEGGVVFVYRYENGAWVEKEMLRAPDTHYNNAFGAKLRLSYDGTRAAIAAPFWQEPVTYDSMGKVYVYDLDGSTFSLSKELVDPRRPRDLDELRQHFWFGYGLDMSGDGSTIVVGSPHEDDAKVLVFEASTGFQFAKELTTPNGKDFDYFGHSVAVSYDGSRIVAALLDGDWQVEVFDNGAYSQSLTATNMGSRMALSDDGNTLLVGCHSDWDSGIKDNEDGGAYLFVNTDSWQEPTVIAPPEPEAEGKFFGQHVSVSGDGQAFGFSNFHNWSERDTGVGKVWMARMEEA
ncbi:WD40 repeat domain-containing protein [Ferrimonas balearica]|uniref:WD40 repeat domain-containing protein n=1 Tax=Ferrimonas balearica TaxID=44012 RepID=UPI001F1E3405|nr:hypothetical protein [Ferrimonas balearica]MBY6093845.1 hypothetical protein [Ferrimonas balearica]